MTESRLGPNHKDGCTGTDWYHSGEGYNRVRVCKCGAEDQDSDYTHPSFLKYKRWMRRYIEDYRPGDLSAREMMELWRQL